MLVISAMQLIENLVYKPQWKFSAVDHTSRFEGMIKVRIDYPARNSNRDTAPLFEDDIPVTYATFSIIVSDCDEVALYKRLIDAIVEIEAHEAREFLRVAPTYWAPFHPHRIDGMKRWAEMTGRPIQFDTQFGLA